MPEIEKNLKNLKIPKENLINLKHCEESKESRKSYKNICNQKVARNRNENPKSTQKVQRKSNKNF